MKTVTGSEGPKDGFFIQFLSTFRELKKNKFKYKQKFLKQQNLK